MKPITSPSNTGHGERSGYDCGIVATKDKPAGEAETCFYLQDASQPRRFAELSSVMPGRPALGRRHDSILGGQVATETTEVTTMDTCPRELSRPPSALPPLTAHHQQQDDQQRGHEHQQGQPHVVPHFESRGGGRELSGGQQSGGAAWAAGARGQRLQGAELGGAGAGRGGTGSQTCPRPGRPNRCRSGPRGATTVSSLRGAGATASGEAGDGRTRCHGGRRGGKRELEVTRRTPGPDCGSPEVPSALGDARCQPLPKAAAAAPPLPAPSPAVAHH